MSASLTVLKYGETVFGENYLFEGGEKGKLLPITFCVYLIESGKRLILVDAGCDDGSGFPMSLFCTPTEALAKAGYTPEQITDVIITHSHHDHVQSIKHFKNATVTVQRDEYEKCKKYIPEEMAVNLFDEECTIDGVLAKRIGGHSKGSSVICFKSGEKTVVLCGDECYTATNLKERIPTGASCDKEKSKRFVEEYSKDCYLPFTCHDPDIFKGKIGAFKII